MLRTTTTLGLAVLLMSVSLVSLGYAEDAADKAEATTEASEAPEQVVEENAGESAAEDATEEGQEEAAAEKAKEQAEEMPPLKAPSPAVKKLNEAVAGITQPLDGKNRAHFYMMYNNHNLISTVKRVKGDVSNAIDACSKENPEMENDLRERYGVWQTAVDEQLEAAQASVDNMIIAQDYVDEKKVHDVMKQADDLREETLRQTERIPVTSKEACEYLLNKMDETQKNLVTLLRSTLVSVPQAMEESNIAPEDLEDQEQAQEPEESANQEQTQGESSSAGSEAEGSDSGDAKSAE